VLQAGTVKFSPVLRKKQVAMKKLRMGEVIRVGLRFRERFWEQIRPQAGGATLRRMGFLFSQDAVFPTWWTQMPSKAPLLVGWSPSWHTRNLAGKSATAIAKRALKSLGGILEMPEKELRAMLLESHVHDWQADPFSRGAYSYVKRGGEPAQQELARAEQATLFFAGEASAADGTNGTVHGALQSGTRAARELLKSTR
jgi:monoamine oxidase